MNLKQARGNGGSSYDFRTVVKGLVLVWLPESRICGFVSFTCHGQIGFVVLYFPSRVMVKSDPVVAYFWLRDRNQVLVRSDQHDVCDLNW